jgi:hypothetical protein
MGAQYAVDLRGQRSRVKNGLDDQLHGGIDAAGVHDGVLGVSGCKQEL